MGSRRLKPATRCFIYGHDKKWDRGFLTPTWICVRCAQEGDLHDHTKMSLVEWIPIIIPTVILGGAILWILL